MAGGRGGRDGLGATYLAKAADLVVRDGPSSALGANANLGWVLALVGGAVLVLREIALRAGHVPPVTRPTARLVSAGFGVLGLALLAVPTTSLRDHLIGHPDPLFGLDPGGGFHYAVLAAGVALLIAVAGLVRSARRLPPAAGPW